MSTPSDNPTDPVPDQPSARTWWPPLPVITGCLVGCLLPAYAYAEAFATLRGFGVFDRKWAPLLFLVPTLVWTGWFSVTGLLLLAPQLLLAALISGLIARVRRTRREQRPEDPCA